LVPTKYAIDRFCKLVGVGNWLTLSTNPLILTIPPTSPLSPFGPTGPILPCMP